MRGESGAEGEEEKEEKVYTLWQFKAINIFLINGINIRWTEE